MDEDKELSKRERKKLNKELKKQEEEKKEEKKSASHKIVVVLLIVAAAIGLWFGVFRSDSGDATESETTEIATVESITEADHVAGNPDADMVLIEYGDFQCPACAAYAPVMTQLREEYGDRIAFVYRHFPLRQLHRNAQIASQASEAAAKQEKFWEMHDLLYEKQDDWADARDPRSRFEEYAAELGLNVDQFKTDMNSDEAKAKVDSDYGSGVTALVNATPSFFLNGEKLQNPPGLEPFKQVLDEKLGNSVSNDELIEEATSEANVEVLE